GIVSWEVDELVQIEYSLAEIRKRVRIVFQVVKSATGFSGVRVARQREHKRVVDLRLRLVAGEVPEALREPLRLARDKPVVHHDERLRGNGAAVPAGAGRNRVGLVENVEHWDGDGTLGEDVDAAAPGGRIGIGPAWPRAGGTGLKQGRVDVREHGGSAAPGD